ncbi:dienelactone hydrolase family protein [Sphingobacterium composti Ten et al. 2007 non Yoo et al. 2007]|uniref:dienelactone hydrolase family protein n=1 Tax=Sphingobacterium composti TaxID=363260 RepID=UPI00135C56D3|nr:dienelactone hydrolase family protein [Sphingobacterium composti Ten et al. 2007 non Yoo et al. 2007]
MRNLLTILFIVIDLTHGWSQTFKEVVYHDEKQKLKALALLSSSPEKRAGVLILPAWKGIDQEAKDAAVKLNKAGYDVFIADIYGEGNIPADNVAAGTLAGQFKSDYKAYQHRIDLALSAFKKEGVDHTKIAVIGYCFGGTGALEVARAGFDVVGVVCVHGGLSKAVERPNLSIKTKVLVQHPAEDKSVSKADYDNLEKELKEGQADYQIITYANSGHTFTNPASNDYNPIMATRAWNHLLIFLEEVLK